ncbi:MAG: hypothetical protein ACXAD7_08950 [Candidatus Kariarchaeaceae archaeon]|jgi:hypothetical protein
METSGSKISTAIKYNYYLAIIKAILTLILWGFGLVLFYLNRPSRRYKRYNRWIQTIINIAFVSLMMIMVVQEIIELIKYGGISISELVYSADFTVVFLILSALFILETYFMWFQSDLKELFQGEIDTDFAIGSIWVKILFILLGIALLVTVSLYLLLLAFV